MIEPSNEERANLPDVARAYLHDLEQRLAGRQRKLDMLGALQHLMRDPERTLVCDVLANGQLLPDPDGSRYGGGIATPRLQEDT